MTVMTLPNVPLIEVLLNITDRLMHVLHEITSHSE